MVIPKHFQNYSVTNGAKADEEYMTNNYCGAFLRGSHWHLLWIFFGITLSLSWGSE